MSKNEVKLTDANSIGRIAYQLQKAEADRKQIAPIVTDCARAVPDKKSTPATASTIAGRSKRLAPHSVSPSAFEGATPVTGTAVLSGTPTTYGSTPSFTVTATDSLNQLQPV